MLPEIAPPNSNRVPDGTCPICSQQTFLKQTHREHVQDLLLFVFKCTSCAVEYPVVSPVQD